MPQPLFCCSARNLKRNQGRNPFGLKMHQPSMLQAEVSVFFFLRARPPVLVGNRLTWEPALMELRCKRRRFHFGASRAAFCQEGGQSSRLYALCNTGRNLISPILLESPEIDFCCLFPTPLSPDCVQTKLGKMWEGNEIKLLDKDRESSLHDTRLCNLCRGISLLFLNSFWGCCLPQSGP